MTVGEAQSLRNGDMVRHKYYGLILTVIGNEKVEPTVKSKGYIKVICATDYGVLFFFSHRQLCLYKRNSH